jgi:hypothetical protein
LDISIYTVYSNLVPLIMEEIEAGCEKLNLPFNVAKNVLKKSDLAKYKPQNTSDLSIILHKTEGRLLLTGENGLYDKLIKHELQIKSKLALFIP